MTYYESVVLQVRKPGDKSPMSGIDGGVTKGTGALPSGTMSVQDKMTVTIRVHRSCGSVDHRDHARRAHRHPKRFENKKNIEGLKAGDQIDITYTRALLVAIDRAK